MAQVSSHNLAHAALDAIAFDGFAKYTACSQADTWPADVMRVIGA
jgi:hypothetical protein